MKKWLAGAFAVLLLIGTCSNQDDSTPSESAALEGAVPGSVDDDEDAAEDTAEARAARREAKRRREARERRARERRIRARRARERRQAAQEAAAATPEPTPTPEPEPTCNTNYEGACLKPDSPDYDCAGGSGDGPDYTGLVRVVGIDEYDLDRDGDGIACDT
jgi:hypothetical protein